jgi:uncharacterized protein YcfJ
MKKLLSILIATAFAMPVVAETPRYWQTVSTETPRTAPRTKEVCKDVVGKDNKPVKNKDGSVKQACKTIKVHKKAEGTKIPDAPKKADKKQETKK